LITPFTLNNEIDFDALGRIIDYNIQNGIDYLVVLGTTGESVTLSESEKQLVFDFVVKHVDKRVPLVAGIGGNNTYEISKKMQSFNTSGYAAFLSVSPYYNKPTQEGIFRHYLELEKVSDLPIIIYNVPGRTASNVNFDTCIRLANSSKKFIGVKEASGNFSQIMYLIHNKPEHFHIISGDDNLTLPMISIGAVGVISVVAQALPRAYSSMVNDALNQNFSSARKLHYNMLEVMELFFAEGNPAGVKAALHHLGLCENYLRLPLVNVSEGLYHKIKKAVSIATQP
jgi:4-hydroxy-tetrahydrodipicolinate synthase